MNTIVPRSTFSQQDRDLVASLFADIGAQTADTEGVSRPAYSAIETATIDYLVAFARKHGLEVEFDAACNALFSLPEDLAAEKFVLVGSHADSVPNGGNFDGLAGILAGLMCLVRAKNEGRRFARPVKVIALRGEESAWYGPCYIGSKALFGLLGTTELSARHKGDNRPLADHMAEIGIDMAPVKAGEKLFDPSCLLAYVELHIEQGPLLVNKDLPVANVSGIRGNFRHKAITCIGEAGHSGAVPRAYRRDPVLAAADLFTRLDDDWDTILQKGDDLVLTSGVVGTDPQKHAIARIPDSISFSLDVRSQDASTLDAMRDLLRAHMRIVERNRKVRFELDDELGVAPALCDGDVVAGISAAMRRLGFEDYVMPSGAGHDAAVFANNGVPTGMIFIRNRNGSHNPREAMEIDDFMAASSVLYEYLTHSEAA
ncbi:allantoate amidohydrolase [Thalassospira profundimaris]|uniref:Allantoate amidohydrolase n=1 Tax=Thalassospira profundimaris TaxID=502049 RepID=A0A367X887_9PROT|nr:Zn-dependent hydrolase [Thalassospira profundimaris]RCK49864.1 allantoate amidohydrolase [Thalassospira profundimaris]